MCFHLKYGPWKLQLESWNMNHKLLNQTLNFEKQAISMGKQILNIISILNKIITVKKIIHFYFTQETKGLHALVWTVTTSSGIMVIFTNVGLDNHFTRESTSIYFEVFNGFAQNAVVHKFNKIFPKLIGCAYMYSR